MITDLNNFRIKKYFENAISNMLDISINEAIDTPERRYVIEQIKKNNLQTTPKEFKESIQKSKFSKMLTDYSIEVLSGMRLFKVPNYNIGYALNGDEIVSVHNNESKIKGIGNFLVQSAIDNGGRRLDHFDTKALNTLYSNNGFVEVDRFPYDSKYDEDGSFADEYGELDVIVRELK